MIQKCTNKISVNINFSVSSVVDANKSLWCDLSTNAVDNFMKVLQSKLGFLNNIFGKEVINEYIEREATKSFRC